MHIAFLALDYPTQTSGGGVGTVVQILARDLVRLGHRVTVVRMLSKEDQEQEFLDQGVRILGFRGRSWHWYLSKLPVIGCWLALSMRELERSWDAYQVLRNLHTADPLDVIELTEEAGLFAVYGFKKVRIITRLHGEHYTFHKYTPDLPLTLGIRLSRRLQRLAIKNSHHLISPSKSHAAEIRSEIGDQCPPVSIIPNPISMSDIPDAPDKIGIDIPDQDPVILYVGRLERRKGVPLLLRAARLVLEHFPDAHFVFAGGRHPSLHLDDLNDMTRELNLGGAVHWLGHLPRPQLASWYRRASLCVLPSYYETFGIAALEPMKFGRPVVAAAGSGLAELIQNGKTGLLFPVGDEQALSEAILRLLEEPKLAQCIGQAGHEWTMAVLDNRGIITHCLAVYTQ